jgi:hypothetical protein
MNSDDFKLNYIIREITKESINKTETKTTMGIELSGKGGTNFKLFRIYGDTGLRQ